MRGVFGVDLDALFLVTGPGKGALTHHPQAGGDTACGICALDQGGPPDAHPASWSGCWYANFLLTGKFGTTTLRCSDGCRSCPFSLCWVIQRS